MESGGRRGIAREDRGVEEGVAGRAERGCVLGGERVKINRPGLRKKRFENVDLACDNKLLRFKVK